MRVSHVEWEFAGGHNRDHFVAAEAVAMVLDESDDCTVTAEVCRAAADHLGDDYDAATVAVLVWGATFYRVGGEA